MGLNLFGGLLHSSFGRENCRIDSKRTKGSIVGRPASSFRKEAETHLLRPLAYLTIQRATGSHRDSDHMHSDAHQNGDRGIPGVPNRGDRSVPVVQRNVCRARTAQHGVAQSPPEPGRTLERGHKQAPVRRPGQDG